MSYYNEAHQKNANMTYFEARVSFISIDTTSTARSKPPATAVLYPIMMEECVAMGRRVADDIFALVVYETMVPFDLCFTLPTVSIRFQCVGQDNWAT